MTYSVEKDNTYCVVDQRGVKQCECRWERDAEMIAKALQVYSEGAIELSILEQTVASEKRQKELYLKQLEDLIEAVQALPLNFPKDYR